MKIKFTTLVLIVTVSFFQIVTKAFAEDYHLVSPSPTNQVQSLANYLHSMYGKGIVSGQMDETWVERIYEASGKYPALIGYDLDGVQEGGLHENVSKATQFVKNKGGIAQFNWHWVRPDGQGDYYSKGFDLQSALADTNSIAGRQLMNHIHKAAFQFKALQDSGVAVLWRPLHEAEGAWFWWGMNGKENCQKLYRLMFDIFTKQYDINNLIWVWTSYAGDKENWYPGDDVVDMIVYDYPDEWSYDKLQKNFGSSGKMLGIGENGSLPNPDKFYEQHYSYFMTWDYMILEDWEKDKYGRKGTNSRDWINRVYNAPTTITLDKLPSNLYQITQDSVQEKELILVQFTFNKKERTFLEKRISEKKYDLRGRELGGDTYNSCTRIGRCTFFRKPYLKKGR